MILTGSFTGSEALLRFCFGLFFVFVFFVTITDSGLKKKLINSQIPCNILITLSVTIILHMVDSFKYKIKLYKIYICSVLKVVNSAHQDMYALKHFRSR